MSLYKLSLIKLSSIITIFILFNCSESKKENKPVVSLQIPNEKEINEKDAILYANEYDTIQSSLENIINNNYDNPDKAAELILKLSEKSHILGKKISNCSLKSKKKIIKYLKKKEVNEDLYIKIMKMYNNNKNFSKSYDLFVKSFNESIR